MFINLCNIYFLGLNHRIKKLLRIETNTDSKVFKLLWDIPSEPKLVRDTLTEPLEPLVSKFDISDEIMEQLD